VVKLKRFLKSLVLVAIPPVLLQFLVIQPFTVQGTSMIPTLKDEERVMVNKLAYLHINLKNPKKVFLSVRGNSTDDTFIFDSATRRGDIVVATRQIPGPGAGNRVIKRVVGIPGDALEIRKGSVFIDGKRLNEPYVTQRDDSNYPAFTLGFEEYFLLGDNRAHSGDSRQWGTVRRQNIIGKVWFVIWPLSRLGAS